MILVTGHPRSGTKYMAQLLSARGLDVKWERMGRDGMSAWQWAVADLSPWDVSGGGFTKAKREHHDVSLMIHVVRRPRDVIASTFHTEGPKWRNAIGDRLGLKPVANQGQDLEHAVRCVVGWNRMIQKQEPQLVVRLEDQRKVGWADRNGRDHPPMSWPWITNNLTTEALAMLHDWTAEHYPEDLS